MGIDSNNVVCHFTSNAFEETEKGKCVAGEEERSREREKKREREREREREKERERENKDER